MFDPHPAPRAFSVAPGLDFTETLAIGLEQRLTGTDPADWGRVEIWVNTARMKRLLTLRLGAGPGRILPRIRVVTELAEDPLLTDLPLPVAPLRRQLDLSQLVRRLIEAEPDIAPPEALYAVTESLAALMDEMASEGVTIDRIRGLDVSDQSGHWARAVAFMSIVGDYLSRAEGRPDRERRQRAAVEAQTAAWQAAPPDHPVLVAGSTGSRGATFELMRAVARLPQGALVLPGFDDTMPAEVWDKLDADQPAEDHPQYRYRALTRALDLDPTALPRWADLAPPAPERNRLISLALRPSPVTDQWLNEAPDTETIEAATAGMTLVEAPSPRAEAETIALGMRAALADGRRVALVTPDRDLTRQVARALERFDLVADDSAGIPLGLSPPGRFLRQVARAMGQDPEWGALLALLKHPLAATGTEEGRRQHLLWTRMVERRLRSGDAPRPGRVALQDWVRRWSRAPEGLLDWIGWVGEMAEALAAAPPGDLAHLVRHHVALAERLAAGPSGEGTGGLWDREAGRAAQAAVANILDAADAGHPLSVADYRALFETVLAGHEVRNPDAGHPNLRILGTLEVRNQTADLVILAGLNEGVWPGTPSADPWLNRALRRRAGLLLPDRQTGLSAHDFQQAVAAPEVWLTRAIRSDEAETVPSRWLNRLTNLLGGAGPDQLSRLRTRGRRWLARAEALSRPGARHIASPALRPSPRPPAEKRPRTLWVTDIGRLIRDPYAVYARRILDLRPLDPIEQQPDARLRGTVIHLVMEDLARMPLSGDMATDRDAFLALADRRLSEACPWPTVRRQWRALLAANAEVILSGEAERRERGNLAGTEVIGEALVQPPGITLKAKADRVDLDDAGRLHFTDFKTGTPPTENQQKEFEKQLLLTAAMAERGGFADLGGTRAASAVFVGLGKTPKTVPAPLEDHPAAQVWAELETFLSAWDDPGRGYTARMTPKLVHETGDYDHLSRYGEWSMTDDPAPEEVGR